MNLFALGKGNTARSKKSARLRGTSDGLTTAGLIPNLIMNERKSNASIRSKLSNCSLGLGSGLRHNKLRLKKFVKKTDAL